MKKRLIMVSSILFTISLSAQVGINTTNPLGIFHVDAAKDNAANPTAAQTANDFVVNSSGNVGIGNASPSTKLHVSSATSPAFRLVDGTQGAGKVLKSDDSGNASWIKDNTTLPTIIATLGAGATISAVTVDPNLNGTDTGTRVTLPPNSKYIVMCYMLIRTTATVPSTGYAWLQSTFTESPTSNTGSSDILGSYYISGAIIPNQDSFNMMNGAIVIQNSSSVAKTYYYRVRLAFSKGITAGTQIQAFGGNAWGENNIIATGIN